MAKQMEVGTKVVLKGPKITGTFRQYLGEEEEDMVILLTKPQKDGAQTIICPTSEVEVLKFKKSSEKEDDEKEGDEKNNEKQDDEKEIAEQSEKKESSKKDSSKKK